MGTRGPVPKREDQRVRRNKDDVPVEKVTKLNFIIQPPLAIDDPLPMIVDFWDSLANSAQAQYYEPSDWQLARVTLHVLNAQLRSGRIGAQMFSAITSTFNDLLVSEGARRRVRIEVEREQTKADVVDIAKLYEQRLAQ